MVMEIEAYENDQQISPLLARLIGEVESGETVFITRNGRRIAELIPVDPTTPAIPGKAAILPKKSGRGCAKGKGFYMAPDFDSPLQDFSPYM